MTSLNEQILQAIQAFPGSDYDQRSALGMARTWIDKGIVPEWNPNQVRNEARDNLAKELVATLDASGAEPEEMITALVEARAWVNAPHQVGEFSRQAKQKGEYGKSKQSRAGEDPKSN